MLKWFCAIALIGLPLVGLSQSAMTAEALSRSQRQQFEQVIRDYLLEHPELIAEALERLEAKRQAETEDRNRQLIAALQPELFRSPYDHVANPDGRIPVVEFFDYQCGYCKRVRPAIERLRTEQADVRLIYKEFPILGPASVFAAKAAIASRRQGGDKYVALHNALLALKGGLDQETVFMAAREVGLDVERLKQDMEAPEVEQAIEFNRGLAQQMNVRGTPTIIVGQTLLPGAVPYERLAQAVQEARENCAVC